jgi:pimeloyl-ACP methyl ester carboxylesterase
MKTTVSKDGTRIAFEQLGSGPPLILVDGAFCNRTFGPMPKLAPLLATRFTVVHYDRRGRGESSDTAPYSVDRELEDLTALADCVDGIPCLYGTSSGAALAMLAVSRGLKVKKLALYEPPFSLDNTNHPQPPDFREQIHAMLKEGRRDDAMKMFMASVGMPRFAINIMRWLPGPWPQLRKVAHTLDYDFAVLGETQSGNALPDQWRRTMQSVSAPTHVMVGSKSPPWMQHSVKTVASHIPGATTQVINGQDHNASAKSVAPELLRFFTA